jgi:hypothetical protein
VLKAYEKYNRSKMGRSSHFQVTVNNHTEGLYERFKNLVARVITQKTRVTFIACQEELGESGTDHIQGYVQLNCKYDAKKFSDWLEEQLGVRPHTEACKGSSEQNVDYCSKADTRKVGTEPFTNGVYEAVAGITTAQGQRTDLQAVQNAIDEGASLDDLIAEHFVTWAKYDRFLRQYHTDRAQRATKQLLISETSGTILRNWQTNLLDSLQGPPVPRKVRWWWDERGNVGKSFMGNHLRLHHSAVVCQMMKKADLCHLLTKMPVHTTCVVFDLTRSHEAGAVAVVYEMLEMLSNSYICSGKYDSCAIDLPKLNLVVFANFAPDLSAMSADRWDVHHIASV